MRNNEEKINSYYNLGVKNQLEDFKVKPEQFPIKNIHSLPNSIQAYHFDMKTNFYYRNVSERRKCN